MLSPSSTRIIPVVGEDLLLDSLISAKETLSDKKVVDCYFTRIIILIPGFYVEPGTESLASLSIYSSQATAAALSFFKNDKFCHTEDDFQPLHYNLVTL